MKARTVPLLFLLVILILGGGFFLTRRLITGNTEKQLTRAKIVAPKTSVSESDDDDYFSSGIEAEKYETFVPLLAGETLLSTLTLDINNDGYDDEVIVVRRADSQNTYIVPAILNQETGAYTRLPAIETPFTRMRAFSYTGMDVTGDHKNALIYQGIDNSGNYVMEILTYDGTGTGGKMISIGSFSSDGTVFIQQTERSESYELSLSRGESFSVWVYKSDKSASASGSSTGTGGTSSGLNQIQQEYRWNPSVQHYALAQEIVVPAGRLAAKELSRIQDGTVETFGEFLEGLWYKTSNSDGNIRYLFFDYKNSEIIQLYSDIQEVYSWDDSKLRHNGIYITAVNEDIMSLTRRFDLSLVNVDEIKVAVHDSVNLLIKENTLWDGEYKKMSLQSTFENEQKDGTLEAYKRELKNQQGWNSADSSINMHFDDLKYTARNDTETETGVYSVQKIGDTYTIQFRSDSEESILAEYYALSFGSRLVTETVRNQTVEKTVTDYETIIFTPIKVTPTECFASEGKSYTMSTKTDDIL